MPSRAPRPCAHPGCGSLTTNGRCDKHPRNDGWAPDSIRGNRHQRGYGSEWEKTRKVVLRRDRYTCGCEDCRKTGVKAKRANEVDHIIPKFKGGTDDLSNLMAINSECHKRKTARESRS